MELKNRHLEWVKGLGFVLKTQEPVDPGAVTIEFSYSDSDSKPVMVKNADGVEEQYRLIDRVKYVRMQYEPPLDSGKTFG